MAEAVVIAAAASDPPRCLRRDERTAPIDEPIALRLRVRLPRTGDTVWERRSYGDLDNFITGVCDALQKGNLSSEDDWADLEPAAHPTCALVFTDDSWVRRIEAEIVPAHPDDVGYVVAVAPLTSR